MHGLRLCKVVQRLLVPGWLSLLVISVLAADERAPGTDSLAVGAFSKSAPGDTLPEGWEALTFSGIERHTRYRLVQEDSGASVQAQSQASASGLIRNLAFDAHQYPWLAWRWKIEHVLEKGDVRTKQGDDYAARIYVAFEFEPQKATWWQRLTHAIASQTAGRKVPGTLLTYIWANNSQEGGVVDNPYTDQVKMVVLQSGNAKAGQWIAQRRNLLDDYVLAFGQAPPPAIGVAIMTDTDGTGEATSAFYGDIWLSQDK